jgi:hypothetical protein
MPTPNSQLSGQTPVVGIVAQKSHFLVHEPMGFDKINLEVLAHPNPGVYSFGVDYRASILGPFGGLTAGLGLNALWMPNPSLDKTRQWDYQLNFTVGYSW